MAVANRVTAGDGDPRHGKESTYRNHKCHCDLCRAAVNAENRRRDQAKAVSTRS
jgi:hypothetical protein